MHYILEASRYTNTVYVGFYLLSTYIERLFSTACYFLSYFCCSVNCMGQASKFQKFFPNMFWNWGKIYIWGLLLLWFAESSVPTFSTSLGFFHLTCKLLKSLFSHHFLSLSKAQELLRWFLRCSEGKALIYIWDFLVFLFMESSISTVCAYSDVFLVCKLYKLGLKIVLLLLDYLRFIGSIDIGGL